MRKVGWLILVLVLTTFVGFGQTPNIQIQTQTTSRSDSASSGSVVDGTFHSEKYGLSLEVPANFHVLSAAENKLLTDAGRDAIKTDSSANDKIDEAVKRTESLLIIASKPLGSLKNNVIEVAALKQAPRVTSSMVLANSIVAFKGSAYSLKRALGNVKLGANTFAAAEFEVTLGGMTFGHRMYIIMHRGNSVVMGLSYHSEAEKIELEKVASNLVLAK
jgi:hypothetical protein